MISLKKITAEENIHLVFEFSILTKGLHALIEIIGGLTFLLISQTFLSRIVLAMTHGELIEDPQDSIAQYLLQSAQQLSINSKHFVAIYLLSHGIIKLFLVVGLLRKKLWAYPLSMAVFTVFIGYQLFRFTHTHSPWLLVISVFDLIVIGLTWHEYQHMAGQKASTK